MRYIQYAIVLAAGSNIVSGSMLGGDGGPGNMFGKPGASKAVPNKEQNAESPTQKPQSAKPFVLPPDRKSKTVLSQSPSKVRVPNLDPIANVIPYSSPSKKSGFRVPALNNVLTPVTERIDQIKARADDAAEAAVAAAEFERKFKELLYLPGSW